MRFEQVQHAAEQEAARFAERFYPSWLLAHTDELICSSDETKEQEAHELLDLYSVFGDEVSQLLPQQREPELPQIVSSDQLCFDALLNLQRS